MAAILCGLKRVIPRGYSCSSPIPILACSVVLLLESESVLLSLTRRVYHDEGAFVISAGDGGDDAGGR